MIVEYDINQHVMKYIVAYLKKAAESIESGCNLIEFETRSESISQSHRKIDCSFSLCVPADSMTAAINLRKTEVMTHD